MYIVTSLIFLGVAGIEALLVRIQLAVPDNHFVSPQLYNQLFTMHGWSMIFLVTMPLGVGLINYIMPLQIGARDVAFPRLNALSYWVYLFAGLTLHAGYLFGQAADAGWVGYANLTELQYSPGPGISFWVVAFSIAGISSIMGGVNFITTIINLRAPGMKFMRMPLFTWMAFVTSFIIVTALPVIGVALILLAFDRFFGANFFSTNAGGNPILWQHLFWLFGHPEVYLMILPSFGIISEIMPTFSRKPLFGYPVVVYAGALIGFIGWGVWAHHMFTVGLGPIADSFFVTSSMIIAIPTGVKIFNWLGTMWGGRIRITSAMLWAIGMIAVFTVGGLSGVMHASAPVDLQQHDSYFVVAHFHYVVGGGALVGLIAGLYYWFPKMTGRYLDEGLGKWHFWLGMIGFNLTFFPMHFSGLYGMPRRVFTYSREMGIGDFNIASTIGGFIFAVSTVIFLWNLVKSAYRGEPAPGNAWEGPTLEWSMPSPPPEYNFADIPEIHSREPLWDEPETIEGAARAPGVRPEMPSPSFWPLVVGIGITATWILVMTGQWWAPLIGLAFTAFGVFNFALEPAYGRSS
jgi:cytochrome c oxidase subunit 1